MTASRDSLLIWAFVSSVGVLLVAVAIIAFDFMEVDTVCIALPLAIIEGGLLLYLLVEYSKKKEKKG